MFSFLWFLIIGGILGWLAGLILGKDIPGGIIGNIVAGIIGSWLGGTLLGEWGPMVSDFYIVPALIGAIVLIFVVSLILKAMSGKRA
ncbi:membrane protein [Lysinibacillus sp. BF-4]|uniref:GlsB/YeaQ/YmgE family stress response membrane protein n=1 Tax=Lysinibacillus sp. BF-4 TaxID=1473546 RepID=UPI0005003043|nr:GlsB/YeaQ/YmgE family stress response membrane protein [Lysinibacillus sp. BF-4]KFL42473.1 membrane protein [Lysinibacillus sp. BF-4]